MAYALKRRHPETIETLRAEVEQQRGFVEAYRGMWIDRGADVCHLERRIAALKGVITKMKRREAS